MTRGGRVAQHAKSGQVRKLRSHALLRSGPRRGGPRARWANHAAGRVRPTPTDIVYGMILTYGRGAVIHLTKKIGLLLDSSMESEAVASAKAGESVTYLREVLRALGDLPDGPTPILTDNQANLMVAKDAASASRARHFLRRYTVLHQQPPGSAPGGFAQDG